MGDAEQHFIVLVQVEVSDLLILYWNDVRYGPSFPCVCCQTLHWRKKVIKLDDVAKLRTQEGRSTYLDTEVLDNSSKLFVMLDQFWICRECRNAVEEDRRPKLSAMNGLSPTWQKLPESLVRLTLEELDLLALTQMFSIVHGLSTGDDTKNKENKTLLLPLKKPVHDEGRPKDPALKIKSVFDLHAKPAGRKHLASPELMVDALTHILQHSRVDAGELRQLLQTWFQERQHNSSQEDSQTENSTHEEGVDRTVNYVTIPPLVSDLLTDAKQTLYCGALDKRLRDLYDVCGDGGIDLERQESITDKQWLIHRLRSVFRRGPSNDVVLIMGMFHRLELSWLNQVRGDQAVLNGALMKHKGTQEYYSKSANDIAAMARCYGPANFAFSSTMNANSPHFLAAFIAQGGETDGLSHLQVWDHQDEREMLTLQPGKEYAVGEVGYFVHERSGVRYDNCKFHTNCKRTPLADWGRW